MAGHLTTEVFREELSEALDELRIWIHEEMEKMSGVQRDATRKFASRLNSGRGARLTSLMNHQRITFKERKEPKPLVPLETPLERTISSPGRFSPPCPEVNGEGSMPGSVMELTRVSDPGPASTAESLLHHKDTKETHHNALRLSRDNDVRASSREVRDMCSPGARYSMIENSCNAHGRENEVSMSTTSMRATVSLQISCLSKFVKSRFFDYCVFFCIILNLALLGFETDHVLVHGGREPIRYVMGEAAFCIFFSAEFLIRYCAHGRAFWKEDLCMWHGFDLFLLCLQWSEVACYFYRSLLTFGLHAAGFDQLCVLRVLRVFRVVRLGRVRVFQEPREMLSSVVGSMKPFLWIAILIVALTFTMSIIMCQLILMHGATARVARRQKFFGSLLYTMLTVFESITGGLSWDEAIRPLFEVSLGSGFFYCFYIAFCVFSVMNVVTGVFVQRATEEARKSEDTHTANLIRDVFMNSEDNDVSEGHEMTNKEIDSDAFMSMINRQEMQEYFAYMGIDASEGEGLFKLLDADGNGSLRAEELVEGCLRIRGEARALELSVLTHLTNDVRMQQLAMQDMIQDLLGRDDSVQRVSSHAKDLAPKALQKTFDTSQKVQQTSPRKIKLGRTGTS